MKKRIKKTVLLCATLSLMLFSQVQAAQTYSDNWKEDDMGNWHFYNDDGTLVKDAWVHDYNEWYLLDSTGTMRTGVFRSNGGKYYVLDTVRGTGTYGKLLKNGMVYQGVVLQADTSSEYEGALDDETLEQLAAVGVEVVNVPNVENTIHVDKDAERARGSNGAEKVSEKKEESKSTPGFDNISEEQRRELAEMFGLTLDMVPGGSSGGLGYRMGSIDDLR